MAGACHAKQDRYSGEGGRGEQLSASGEMIAEIACLTPVISEIGCATLFSLRGGFQSGAGEREQGLYGNHEADGEAVLVYDG